MSKYAAAMALMTQRFGKDSLIALATVDGTRPTVRAVDGYYEDGAFYIVTHALSNKMKQIALNPAVALSGEWFTAQGVAENLGHVLLDVHTARMARLREVFSGWYTHGDVNEADPNTILLKIRLTDGVLMHQGTDYRINFVAGTVAE